MKKILCAAIVFSLSTPSNAGWFDDIMGFFGSDDSDKKTTEQIEKTESTESPTEGPGSTTQMIKTGLALIPLLVEKLGVTDAQASGGLGALLSAAQSLMAANQFSSLLSAIPNASGLMAAVPKPSSSSSDLMGSAIDLAKENSGTIKAGADLVSQFSALGLNADMISQFTDVTADYLTQSDKKEEAGALSSVISSLF